MNWQFWAIFWGWIATSVILVVVGLVVSPFYHVPGNIMLGLGIFGGAAFIGTMLFLAHGS